MARTVWMVPMVQTVQTVPPVQTVLMPFRRCRRWKVTTVTTE